MSKIFTKLAALSLILLLTSCETPRKPIPTTEAACSAIEPLPYHYAADDPECSTDPGSSDPRNSCDTIETVRVIMAFNEGLKGLCAVRKG